MSFKICIPVLVVSCLIVLLGSLPAKAAAAPQPPEGNINSDELIKAVRKLYFTHRNSVLIGVALTAHELMNKINGISKLNNRLLDVGKQALYSIMSYGEEIIKIIDQYLYADDGIMGYYWRELRSKVIKGEINKLLFEIAARYIAYFSNGKVNMNSAPVPNNIPNNQFGGNNKWNF